ncbi:sodium/proline symporter [Thiocapsa imhoffii]|uniref:Sodium/proline symporter n=1 Tax=Thiocapsa imhoffii TaxID=382777 RepID=A0A9X0WHG6_9GAMM|nr:sodium/proline symporter PutP [Thiocapsa imhoffii]MBK1644638.1 sodium/proline symporter [Thiocapsa imhoffii]
MSLTFAVYFLVVGLIGWYAYQRTKDLSDFILGGRRLSSGVAALSAGASDMSGWLLLGLPGFAYAAGLESIWLAVGLLLGTWANWRLVAARLRVFSAAYGNALTLPEYFARRFEDQGGWLRGVAAFFILLFFLLYTSAGLVAGGKLFQSVFGLPYLWAVSIGALTIMLYTAVGGFLAVSWTDVLQGVLMALALVIVPWIAFSQVGDPTLAFEVIEASNPNLLDPFTRADGTALGILGILSLAAWGLGYFGQPHILARFQAIASARQVPLARWIAVSWVAVTLTGATLTGLAGILIIEQPLTAEARETVFILMVDVLFHPLVAGFLLAAILAAIMSTADSQLLVSSSTFTEDLYRTVLRRQAGTRELVAVGRLSVLIVAAAAFWFAMDPEAMVLDLVAYAWAGFGAAFGPALVLSLYWPRMTGLGALAGITIGGLTVLGWRQLDGGLFDLYEIVPGILFSTLAIILISRRDQAHHSRLSARFKKVEKMLRKELA